MRVGCFYERATIRRKTERLNPEPIESRVREVGDHVVRKVEVTLLAPRKLHAEWRGTVNFRSMCL
jgi:hypothetical protein